MTPTANSPNPARAGRRRSPPAPRRTSIRLALLYALADGKRQIGPPHLNAALALQDYAARSAAWALTGATGEPLAEQIHAALAANPDGLTRSQVRDLFSRNRRSKDIGQALERLAAAGRIHAERHQQRGRPAELWHARRGQPAGS